MSTDSPTTIRKATRFSFSSPECTTEQSEGSIFSDTNSANGNSHSYKLTSPIRMFGKSLSNKTPIPHRPSRAQDLDQDGGGGAKTSLGEEYRVDVGSLPIIIHSNQTEDSVKLNVTFNDFTSVQHICDGSNSNLFRCKWEDKLVIVKRLKIERINTPHVLGEFEFESEFLRRASECPYLVRIWASGCDKISEFDLPENMEYNPSSQLSITSADTDERQVLVPFVVIERLNGGTLSSHLAKARSFHSRPFTLTRVFQIWSQLAEALTYIHEKFDPKYCVIHRDLKPDNVCFDQNGNLKLIDFGLSICVKKTGASKDGYFMTGGTGSLRYMAPEVASSQPYNDRADVYSFGIIAYEVLTGVAPYGSMNKEKFVSRVVVQKQRPDVNVDDFSRRIRAPQRAKDLIVQCWQHDYSLRPSASEVLAVCQALYEEEKILAATKGSCICS